MADSTRVSEGVRATAAQERARDQSASTGEVFRHSATDAVRQARSKLREAAEDQKHRAAQGIRGFAHSLHDMAGGLELENRDIAARYAQIAAEQLDRTAEALDRRDMAEMAGEVEAFAQARPAIFVGGAFAAGFLLARFLKSAQAEPPVPHAVRGRASATATGYAEYEPLRTPPEQAGSATPFTATPTEGPGAQRPGSQS